MGINVAGLYSSMSPSGKTARAALARDAQDRIFAYILPRFEFVTVLCEQFHLVGGIYGISVQ